MTQMSESEITWRGLSLPGSVGPLLDRVRDLIERPDPRTEEILSRASDEYKIRKEIVESGVSSVLNADPGLIGARLGQCQAYKDRLGQLYHDVDFAYQFWKGVYEKLKSIALSSKERSSFGGSEGERVITVNNRFIAREFETMERFKNLREAISYRQSILAQEGETLSRQLSALTLQWTLIEKRGGSITDLTWESADKGRMNGTDKVTAGRGMEDW